MVYLHKPSNCFILSNIFLRHKQRWKKCSILLKFNMLGGVPRVYVGTPPNLHKGKMFIFHALCALLNSKTYQNLQCVCKVALTINLPNTTNDYGNI